MTDQPESGAPNPAAATAAPAPDRNQFLIGTLFTLAAFVGVFAVMAVWVNRQALNTDHWTATSTKLLADKQIQTAIAAYTVSELFRSGAIQSEIKSALPPKFQALSGPAAAGLQQVAGQLAPRVLASPRVQTVWAEANRRAHRILLKIVNGGGTFASTNGGKVTLDLHAIVTQLAASLGVQKQVAAVQSKIKANPGAVNSAAAQIGVTIPPTIGQLTILRSSQLQTAQDVASAISGLAIVLPVLAFLLLFLAVWLSRGHRRQAIRMTGFCFIGIGIFVLLVRRVAGNDVVDGLVKNPANLTAAHHVWTIATALLHDIAVAMVAYGLIFVASAWLAGEKRPAKALRRAMAPTLRESPATGYIVVYVALLLVVLWGPTPATRQLAYIVLFVALLGLGVRALRRQTAAEYPDAQAGDAMGSLRAWYAERRAPAAPAAGAASHVAELERLALLHDRGALTDAEFATEKAVLVKSG